MRRPTTDEQIAWMEHCFENNHATAFDPRDLISRVREEQARADRAEVRAERAEVALSEIYALVGQAGILVRSVILGDPDEEAP